MCCKPCGGESNDAFVRVFKRATGDTRYPVQTTVEEELQACTESRSQSIDIISNMLGDLKAGRNIKVQEVRHTIKGMMASILRNPDAFFWLTRLKNKDNYAYAHCIDACGLAMAFGRHLGFSKPELEDLAVGTLLFDIGKLQLPEDLLKKPGRLTTEEYN